MRLNCNSFFDGDFKYINLNSLFLQNQTRITDTKIPSQIQAVLDESGYLTYGGYGEDRKDVWKGTYLDKTGGYIHLGIDINVPVGTFVRCPMDLQLEEIYTDVDDKIGWGGRIILRDQIGTFLVLAHLAPESLIKADGWVKQGDILGTVGTWPTNGNTFHHLHVQAIATLTADFDGYGYQDELANNPDPFQIWWEPFKKLDIMV